MLGVGEVLPFSPTRRRAASLPVDVARTIEEALGTLPLDIVHVHEPFAPSASSVALRQSRASQRGQLPRADRADPLDPADQTPVAAAVRPPRRPHRQLRRHPRSAPALLPRRLPGDPARGRGRAGAMHGPRAGASCCSPPPRSAPRCESFCGRCEPCRPSPPGAPRCGPRVPLAAPATLSAIAPRPGPVRRRRADVGGTGAGAAPTCWCSPPRGSGLCPGRS